MAKRPAYRRPPEEFKRGTLVDWKAPQDLRQSIAHRVTYVPSGEHKTYPSPEGLWSFGPKVDKAKCDKYRPEEWPRLQEALKAAILAPCVHGEFRGEFPARAWAYINDVLHEARLTNAATGEYHGFPLMYDEQIPEDPHDLLRKAPRATIPVH